MPLHSWLLGTLLVSQAASNPGVPVTITPPKAVSQIPAIPTVPAVTRPGTPAIEGTPKLESGVAPARTIQTPPLATRVTTPQLVADALALPPGNTISGQPVSLVSVVATAPERQRQIEAVHAYWRLSEAVGDYHFCFERQQRLTRLSAGNDEAADLRTAQAIAAAQIREAEVIVTTAQHDLAEVLLLAPSSPLPLPADQPLVGPYRTLFVELYAGKKAPDRARALDQTLPLRNRAVEGHAAALLAAEDALDAAIELQASGQGRLAGVLAALNNQTEQQRAFLAAVCRYNHDIADYSLVVVSPQTTPELLVGTLIKQNRPAGQPVIPLPTTATLPTSYQQPVVAPAAAMPASRGIVRPPVIPNLPTGTMQPTNAASRIPPLPDTGRSEETGPANSPAVVAPPNPLPSNEPEEPRLAPPQESAIPLVPEKPDSPTPHTSRKPISESEPPQASALGLYPGLAALTPADRAARLVLALHSDRKMGPAWEAGTGAQPVDLQAAGKDRPATAGQPLRLIDCLRAVPADRRANVVAAYWTARQIAGEYQGSADQLQWLESLGPTLTAQNPPSPLAMLQFRAARLAVEAEMADTEVDSRAARFKLAVLAALETEKTLPQPTTVPFTGRYPLAASFDRSWPQRRLAATIPQQEQAILAQVVAVVEADASRAAATADFLAGRSTLERVLAAIEIQARETSAFLGGVTDYNRSIAHYAAAAVAKNAEPEKLLAALMVE